MTDMQSANVRVRDLSHNGELVGREGRVITQAGDTVFVDLPPDEFPFMLDVKDVEVVA